MSEAALSTALPDRWIGPSEIMRSTYDRPNALQVSLLMRRAGSPSQSPQGCGQAPETVVCHVRLWLVCLCSVAQLLAGWMHWQNVSKPWRRCRKAWRTTWRPNGFHFQGGDVLLFDAVNINCWAAADEGGMTNQLRSQTVEAHPNARCDCGVHQCFKSHTSAVVVVVPVR